MTKTKLVQDLLSSTKDLKRLKSKVDSIISEVYNLRDDAILEEMNTELPGRYPDTYSESALRKFKAAKTEGYLEFEKFEELLDNYLFLRDIRLHRFIAEDKEVRIRAIGNLLDIFMLHSLISELSLFLGISEDRTKEPYGSISSSYIYIEGLGFYSLLAIKEELIDILESPEGEEVIAKALSKRLPTIKRDYTNLKVARIDDKTLLTIEFLSYLFDNYYDKVKDDTKYSHTYRSDLLKAQVPYSKLLEQLVVNSVDLELYARRKLLSMEAEKGDKK